MGKYDLWNKNTKRWADKYGVKIIKKYPKYGCVHKFELTAKGSQDQQTFKCFSAAPSTGNEDGNVIVLVDNFGYGYCVPGDDVDGFLKEYSQKVVDARWHLILKYNNVSQYKSPAKSSDNSEKITFVLEDSLKNIL